MPKDEMQPISEQDLSQGYCIKIEVLPDGFTVSDPLPLESESDEGEVTDDEYTDTDEDVIPDLTSMLKNVMAVVNENPVGESESSAFEKTADE